ncbi:murein hydrolase activator EnvC family protein [Terrabacter sp. RAF57]|uniref:murein hydrolase activator EnvC family protein n=1 Tax=Terrabacter sp. RAF57 TaxID=3233063 RepID=UPI003F9DE24F
MSIGSALLSAVLAVASVAGASAAPFAPVGMAGARPATQVASSPSAARWGWPFDPEPEVVRRFDPPDQPWLPGHRGVDLAATVGQPVRAPAAGRVSWSGVIAGRAVVVVAHDSGLRSTFEPVAAVAPVGTAVGRGDTVGVLTGTPGHCAPGTCLHWGVLRGETYLDPLSFVGRAPVVLLPLT